MAAVIGFDVGSQSLKGVLVGGDGAVLAEAAAPYDLLSRTRAGRSRTPEIGWAPCGRSLPGSSTARGEGREIESIGLATQVDGVVAVGADGEPLRPAIIWMDRRAEAQSAALGDLVPAGRIFDLTGLNLDSSHVAPKILWLRDVEPEVFASAEAFLLPGSYLVHRLTGETVVDYSNASSSMLYDVREKGWSEEMLAAADLDAGEARKGRGCRGGGRHPHGPGGARDRARGPERRSSSGAATSTGRVSGRASWSPA